MVKFECYVLQKGLASYFQKLETDKSVICSDSPFRANLFDNIVDASKFKSLLKSDYKEEFLIKKL